MRRFDDDLDLDLNEMSGMKPVAKKRKLGPVAPNLIANMERIVELAKASQLDSAFLKQVDNQLEFVANKMNVSKNGAMLLSLFVEMSNAKTVSLGRIGQFLKCSNLKLMGLKADIDSLVNKGYLKIATCDSPFDDDCNGYTLPKGMAEAVMANKAFKPEPITGLTMAELFDHIGEIFEQCGDLQDVMREVDILLKKNKKLIFSQKMEKDMKKVLNLQDRFLFLLFCNELVNEGNESVCDRDWRRFYIRRVELRMIKENLQSNNHPLQKLGLIESNPDNGMFGQTYRLSTKTKMDYLEGLNILESQSMQAKDLLKWDSFAEKHLFYNDKEQKQIEQITDLLQEERFKEVQTRLEESGMRKGFACLFYGAPGTGKTETVNQLARQTGRDVMVIDVSRIKDKFVGESEKNIKEAFDRYRCHVQRCVKAPILLFNEADAVLGIRKEGANTAVDKMENSIQNIILQEMEKLDGIMIATTNLTQNLDSAFERRFIYKVEFQKPSVEAKKAIWKSMIPSLREPFAQILAERYDFSGGQIENIARKRAVCYVLTGEEPSEEAYFEFCDAESIQQKQQRKKVGFC